MNIWKAVHTQYSSASYRITAKDMDGGRTRSDKHDQFPMERQHLDAAKKLIRKRWRNSPEVLDPNKYAIFGGMLGPSAYVWVVVKLEDLPASPVIAELTSAIDGLLTLMVRHRWKPNSDEKETEAALAAFYKGKKIV